MDRIVNRIGLWASLALIFSACSSGTGPENASQVILPLIDGNAWIGTSVDSDSTGSVLRRRPDTTYTRGARIYGGDRFQLAGRFEGMRNAADGLHVWRGESPDVSLLLLPFPSEPGRRLIVDFARGASVDTVSVQVVATDVEVTVAAGTFRCYHYHIVSSTNGYEVDAYLAPDVGFVKAQLVDKAGDRYNLGSSVWELRQYSLR